METQSSPTASIKSISDEPRWNFGTRVAFRFAFSYLVLYVFPFPLGYIPYTDWPSEKYQNLWHAIVPWVGKHILHLGHPITIFTNGSGDTTYDYFLALCNLALATLAALLWTLFDRRRASYPQLYQWLRLYVRLALGAIMISYGAFKIIPSQFPPPMHSRLIESFGEASPMGLLWAFMGASKGYSIFAGLVEFVGGALLFLPRLVTLGALISAAALTNIFMLNMCYDVPVKLFSFHLLLMAGFLLVPDLQRLANFFLLNRQAEPARNLLFFQRRWLNVSLLCAQLALGALCGGTSLYQSRTQAKQFNESFVDSSLGGIWSVEEFSMDGQLRPPLLTDELRWQRLIVDFSKRLALQSMNGTRRFLGLELDPAKKSLALTKNDDPNWKAQLTFETLEPGLMSVEGPFEGHQIRAKLRKMDESKFLLNSRGFHWINEFPFNR
jgi:uncharacterized membrane protein YphA (DoxX/SURF4 family)